MTMLIFFITALAIVAIIYLAIHRMLINRATLIVRNRAAEITDAAVNTVLSEVLNRQLNLRSETVADVWGRGVMAFEYVLEGQVLSDALTNNLSSSALNGKLAEYAKRQQTPHIEGAAETFRVTDWWEYEHRLHIDVAYLMNEATREYVDDLKKVAKSQGEKL
ncbi:MAG: hypothetical protein LKJ41_06335 [[Lactobacillus] timonensis]|jgi:hypothetical protein|uniref:hypothetical protein n=1 Tax=[Lactobacillus] timonensis TaxID=1970790 RepID=UPI000C84F0C1|nr:hypothetical protein [[Lactobacillus] timonensis]MCI1957978.1 hypothetical protein [[Lactobacillus] timonensis]